MNIGVLSDTHGTLPLWVTDYFIKQNVEGIFKLIFSS